MKIDIEISYSPLQNDFIPPIDSFIGKLQHPELKVITSKLSTMVTGDYNLAMTQIQNAMGELMQAYPSVFHLKITNASPV